MKKAGLITLLSLTAMLAVLLVGCGGEDNISSVSLKDHDHDSIIEAAIGEFDCTDYTLVLTYESGATEEIAITEDMIAEEDLFKLYKEGEQEITVSYLKHKCVIRVDVKRSSFGTLTIPENNVFTYDGEAHSVEVVGDLPASAVVTYPGGNSFVNAGTYDVTAIVSCEGYVTVKLYTTVKIERAVYDMSGVEFEAKEYVYDGSAHGVKITGILPDGVASPRYTINERETASAVDAGEYTVRASFASTDQNYEPIPDMLTTLTITPAEYTVKGVDIVFKKDGKVIDGGERVYDGTAVTFDLSDYNKLSSKVSVAFSVYDGEGNRISGSNKNTNIIDAGVYTVKAEFTLADSKNYKPIEPIVREFEVTRAEYVLSGVEMNSDTATYDGLSHSLTLSGNLPKDVTVSYEYYLGDALIVGDDGKPVQSVVNAGRYTVRAVFAHTDKNRGEIEPVSGILHITQAVYNTMYLMIDYSGELVYDGTAKSVVIKGVLPEDIEISLEYYLNGELVTNADGTPASAVSAKGEYTVKITFNVKNGNYAPIEDMTVTFSIVDR